MADSSRSVKKRNRSGCYPEVERVLVAWYQQVRGLRGIKPNNTMMGSLHAAAGHTAVAPVSDADVICFLDDPDEHVVEGQLTTDELVCAAVPQLGAALRSAVQSPALQAQAAATGVTVPEGDADDVEPAKAVTLQEAQQALAVLQTFMRDVRDAPVTVVSPAMRTSASSIADALYRMRIDRARQEAIFSYVARTG